MTVVDAATTSVCTCAAPATISATATAAEVPVKDPPLAVIMARSPVSDVNVTEYTYPLLTFADLRTVTAVTVERAVNAVSSSVLVRDAAVSPLVVCPPYVRVKVPPRSSAPAVVVTVCTSDCVP